MAQIIDMETLLALTSEARVEAARKAMDLNTISSFKLDARGRIEAGVKPAPPSTEPPAYARITRRGGRYRVDCKSCGRGNWCLHGILLALHHVGAKPITRSREAAPQKEVALGFRLVAAINGAGLRIRVAGRGGFVNNPRRYITREYVALGLDSRSAEQLEALCEDDHEALRFSRSDSAAALDLLKRVTLELASGSPWRRKDFSGQPPKLTVRIKGDALYHELEPALDPTVLMLPGWPGYLVSGNTLRRVAGYLPDFQFLQGLPSPTALNEEVLAQLMAERHGIQWRSPKPILLTDVANPGLNLEPAGRELRGRLGVWHDQHFFPLQNLEDGRQILRAHGRPALLQVGGFAMNRLRDQVGKARLPLDAGAGFTVREGQARRFLEETRLPAAWRVERDQADLFFGLQRLDCKTLWQDGRPHYRVGGQVYDHETLTRRLAEDGRESRLEDGRVLRFDTGDLLANQHILSGLASLHEDETAREQLRLRITEGRPAEPGPAPGAPWDELLRPYQMEGVRWMTGNLSRSEPALLADDMGLGKTIQTLAMLSVFKEVEGPQLVVMPTSLLANWHEEAARFCPERKVYLHHGPNRRREAERVAEQDLILTSYGTLLRDMDMLYDVCFSVVVLDEAQAIKNAASRTARAVSELWCERRVALTGTPVENRLTELWSIFRFLAPDYLGAEEDVKEITLPGTAAFQALKAKVKPFLLRRHKREVADELPQKQEMTVMLPMEDEQRALYEQYRGRSLETLKADGKTGTISILTRLLRLRQACCHPGLLDESRVKTPSNKLNYLVAQLQDVVAQGHGALVFSQFTKFLALTRFALEEAEIPYLYLDGRTRDRQDLVHRFQEGEAPVFLISLKAGGVGLNLTRASYVYHLDPWWNPAVEAQATDRAHRIGQKKNVFSYKIISEGTVEERILRLQAGKKFLSEGLWQDAETLSASLDRETLLGLLG